MLADSVTAIFHALPAAQRAGIAELPAIVEQLEEQLQQLRVRHDELSRAIAEARGRVGSPVPPDGTSARDGDLDARLAARAAVAVEALESGRTIASSRKATALAALDGIRLGLLRLRSGLIRPDELTADLDAAQEIGREIAALLAGS